MQRDIARSKVYENRLEMIPMTSLHLSDTCCIGSSWVSVPRRAVQKPDRALHFNPVVCRLIET